MDAPTWLDELPGSLTEAEYRALPEEAARRIEIVHGHVIKCESPVPRHNRIARRLSSALEAARTPAGPCLTVETGIDVVLWRVPRFTFRRPDVVVYDCLDDPTERPEAARTRLVVEVTSLTTRQADLLDKEAQYAHAGIPLYLVVVLDDKYEITESIEFHLDAAVGEYRLHALHRSELAIDYPIRVRTPLTEPTRA